MVERSIAWLVADGHRRVRYRGVRKNQLGLSLRFAAINLRRLVNLGLASRSSPDWPSGGLAELPFKRRGDRTRRRGVKNVSLPQLHALRYELDFPRRGHRHRFWANSRGEWWILTERPQG